MIAFDNYSHYSGYNEIMSKIMFCYTKTIIDLCTASALCLRAAAKWAEIEKSIRSFSRLSRYTGQPGQHS